jgi:peroxin-6
LNDLGPPTPQATALGVPPDLAKKFPHIFVPVPPSGHPEKTHMLSVVQLVPLQEVFVQALSSIAYSRAKADVSSFESWLCRGQRILRQDSVYDWDTLDGLDPGALTYKLIMAEPVLQGYAQKSQTLFTLLPPSEGSQVVNGNQVLLSSVLDDIQIDDDEESLEIGENFLASSLISQPSSYPQHSPPIRMSHLAHEFTASPLPKPTSLDVDEHTMYVRTVDLSKVGVLDGDWVSINLKIWKENMSNRCQAIARLPLSRNRRIVRLEANDELVGDSYDPDISQFIVSTDLPNQWSCQSFSYTPAQH